LEIEQMRRNMRPLTDLNATLLTVIALLAALAPFATDIYLPTFPIMAAQLHTTPTGVQITLTAFLIGAGAGQLIFGPLSDRIGRRRPLIVGTTICAIAGLASALSPNLLWLTIARLVQGLAGSAGMVLGRAIISDIAKGRAAARAFNLTSVVIGVAPAVAPLIGAVFAPIIGWRGLLGVVCVLSVITLTAVVLFVPETLHPTHTSAKPCRKGLRSRIYMGNMLAMVLGFGAMMAYISASPFVYQTMVGMSQALYGVVFGATALLIAGVSYLSAKLTNRFLPKTLLRSGLIILLIAGAALNILVLLAAPAWCLVVPLVVGVPAIGLVFGNATALALGAVPQAAGTASALLGAAQFVLGAAVAPLVSLNGEHSAAPLAAVFGIAAFLALAASLSASPIRSGLS
jgi:DHA1 family bicyclomycin/chloramphenicol resistance-like MFS transporter